jgi:F0F1-type ATP synthase assembly protein I
MENRDLENPKKDGVSQEEKKEIDRETNREIFYSLELVSKLGISIALIAGFFLMAGIFLDRKFGTGHIFLLVCLVLSIIVSIYDIYVLLEPIIGSEKKKNFLKRKKK